MMKLAEPLSLCSLLYVCCLFELYEVDQGMTIEMDDIPEYSEYDDAG